VNDEPRGAQTPAPRVGRFDVWSSVIFVVHAGLFLALAAWTWRKWSDPIVDFGRELYVPWQLTKGRVLYRDIFSLFGPLSPYVNAAWFRLFGVSLTTLAVCNLAIFAAILAGIYRFVRTCADRFTAVTASMTTLLLFGFSFVVKIGNYNFVTPYAHEATHGLALCIALLLCLGRGATRDDRPSWLGAGACFGLAFLTKPEIGLAALAAVATTAIGLALIDRQLHRLAGHLGVFLLTAAIAPGGFFLYFAGRMPPADALRAVAGAWASLFGSRIASNAFYQSVMGLDRPGANAFWMLLSFAAFCGFLLALGWWAVSRDRQPTFVTRVTPLAVVLLGVVAFARAGAPFAALPLIVAATLVWTGTRIGRTRGDRAAALRFLSIAAWSACALMLLAKMGLRPSIVHYGFYLALPATVVTLILIADLLPRAIAARGSARAARTFRVFAVVVFAAAAVPYLVLSYYGYRQRVIPVGSGGDRFYASGATDAWQGRAVAEAVRMLATARPGTLAVMPEGVMLNYLTRRDSPLKVINLMPPELMTVGEDEVLRSLDAAPPEFVLLVQRDVREYGYPPFGADPRYGERIVQWVRGRYREVRVVGLDPLHRQSSGIAIFQRAF
jgi:hypothetical protein